jgi:hypothetical protein
MSAGSVSARSRKTGAAAETVQEWENNIWKMAQQKTNVFKIECCGSYGQLSTENEKL